MDATAGETIEVSGQGGDKGFTFAGHHFCDATLVEDNAADHLDIVVAHFFGAFGGFADCGKCLGQE